MKNAEIVAKFLLRIKVTLVLKKIVIIISQKIFEEVFTFSLKEGYEAVKLVENVPFSPC